MRRLFVFALLMAALGAQAQTAASAPVPSAAPASPAKKALIQRVLTLQQAALDNTARDVAERPAMQMTSSAQQYVQQRVPAEKREAAWGQVQAAVRKYLDEAVPLVKDRAAKLAQTSLSGTLDERFSEDELRQLVTTLEAPAFKKFQQVMPEISDGFIKKLIADAGPSVDPKLKALDQSIATALGLGATGAAPAASGSAPARAAKPATAASKAK